MRKRLIFVLAGVIAFIYALSEFQGCVFIEKIYRSRAARSRVHAVLQGIQKRKDGTGIVGDEQLAICRWYADTGFLANMDALNHATDDFDAWRMGANFYIEEYTIDKIELEKKLELIHEDDNNRKNDRKTAEPWVFIVSGTIDGADYSMRVPEGDTISWIQSPWFYPNWFDNT